MGGGTRPPMTRTKPAASPVTMLHMTDDVQTAKLEKQLEAVDTLLQDHEWKSPEMVSRWNKEFKEAQVRAERVRRFIRDTVVQVLGTVVAAAMVWLMSVAYHHSRTIVNATVGIFLVIFVVFALVAHPWRASEISGVLVTDLTKRDDYEQLQRKRTILMDKLHQAQEATSTDESSADDADS